MSENRGMPPWFFLAATIGHYDYDALMRHMRTFDIYEYQRTC